MRHDVYWMCCLVCHFGFLAEKQIKSIKFNIFFVQGLSVRLFWSWYFAKAIIYFKDILRFSIYPVCPVFFLNLWSNILISFSSTLCWEIDAELRHFRNQDTRLLSYFLYLCQKDFVWLTYWLIERPTKDSSRKMLMFFLLSTWHENLCGWK